jgi:steroid 5-alpha reductase family enzyme
MTILYLEALAGIAASLAILMAGARVVQQRTGNSGWVDPSWTFFLYRIPVYVTGIPPLEAEMLRSRGDRYRVDQLRTGQFFLPPPQKGVVT